MGKAEKFIQDYTRNCSNEIIRNNNDSFTNIPKKGEYCPWLTPDEARKAVEIAREEMVEKAIKWVEYNNENGGCKFDGWVENIKQAMKDGTTKRRI